MRHPLHLVWALLATVVFGSEARSEVRNPFLEQPGQQVLLAAADVQTTLKLTPDQMTKLGATKALDAKLKVLTEEQRRRLRVIDAQREGGYVLTHDRVVDYLALTSEQSTQVDAVVATHAAKHKEMRDFMSRARFRSREAMEEYVAGFRDKADKALYGVLTPDQTEKLETLFGK